MYENVFCNLLNVYSSLRGGGGRAGKTKEGYYQKVSVPPAPSSQLLPGTKGDNPQWWGPGW